MVHECHKSCVALARAIVQSNYTTMGVRQRNRARKVKSHKMLLKLTHVWIFIKSFIAPLRSATHMPQWQLWDYPTIRNLKVVCKNDNAWYDTMEMAT